MGDISMSGSRITHTPKGGLLMGVKPKGEFFKCVLKFSPSRDLPPSSHKSPSPYGFEHYNLKILEFMILGLHVFVH
jgi:hypothetical protein